MDVASWIAGYVAANPVVVDPITNTKAVRHNRSESPEAYRRAGEGAGGKDVVVDGGVGRV